MPKRLPPEDCEECSGTGFRDATIEESPALSVPCECEGT